MCDEMINKITDETIETLIAYTANCTIVEMRKILENLSEKVEEMLDNLEEWCYNKDTIKIRKEENKMKFTVQIIEMNTLMIEEDCGGRYFYSLDEMTMIEAIQKYLEEDA